MKWRVSGATCFTQMVMRRSGKNNDWRWYDKWGGGGGQTFIQQEMSAAIKKMKENKAADENGMNYRPSAILSVIGKLCTLMVREIINKWTEDSGFFGEIQGSFRRGRRTEDNLFMFEVLIEVVKGRKDEIFVDMEKSYDRVNRKKLFEVMRGFGVYENLVGLIERIFVGSMVQFELEHMRAGWCKCDPGVRQCSPRSPLLFNICVRELGKVISNWVHGVKYAVVGKDGVLEWKSQAGFQ